LKQRDIDDTERKIKEIEEDLARDFGRDDALLSLKGKCFELEHREYSYKICPFADVQQIRKGGSHGTVMGRWKSFGEQSYSSWGSKQDYSHMIFTDGEHCWGGPHRSTDVHVLCGAENVVVSVEEPSMCTYKMVFETPAACE
jgi:protein kinase C substrate 80K-H